MRYLRVAVLQVVLGAGHRPMGAQSSRRRSFWLDGPLCAGDPVNQANQSGPERTMTPLIELRHIHKFFGGLCAINDVSLTIGKGEVIGLVGDNAAGKSTQMKIIAGVHKPTSGEYFIEGAKFVAH